jgi:alpha-L-rhamnosidase
MWFYKTLAGINIDPSAPGFERINIKPYTVGDLNYASATVKTFRGLISSGWRKEKNSLFLDVTVPVNSKGRVSLPDLVLKNTIVKEGGKVIWKDNHYIQSVVGITSGKQENGYIVFEIGSGTYSFWIG